MKIWCVDYAGLSYHISSHLFFDKMEAEDFYESRNHCGNYVKMYQVEDIWGWCGRHFEKVVNEVIASRDNGNNFTYIYGLVEELKEAAAHCGLEMFDVEGFWTSDYTFVLSIAWVSEGKLHHYTDQLDALDCRYEYESIVKRRAKYETQNG
jgi:hypothetical protein